MVQLTKGYPLLRSSNMSVASERSLNFPYTFDGIYAFVITSSASIKCRGFGFAQLAICVPGLSLADARAVRKIPLPIWINLKNHRLRYFIRIYTRQCYHLVLR